VNVFLQGMGVGAGLIIAIGAQNVFVLTQGIRKQHHWLIAFICSISDMLLIFVGAAGIGSFVAGNHALQTGAAWTGAIFLIWYGSRALLSVSSPQGLDEGKSNGAGMRIIVTTALALTFLNPHVYIDTIILLGSISGQYQARDRCLFALGASTSSFLWFFSLSLGGSFLAPVFRRSVSWKILNCLVCITMWTIAVQLITMNFYNTNQ
jgi:L-lysine exporter family protein LysE/ArgO